MSTAVPLPAFSLDPAPLLARIVEKPALHGRFLNTLSLLEYVGARKILKSQPAEIFTAQLLAHVQEEVRHALTLKNLALRLDPALSSYRPEHLLEPKAAEHYLQSIDRAAAEDLADGPADGRRAWINYLYTTLLIEERAGQFYPAYAPLLEKLGHGGWIEAIIRDEEGHLRQMVEALHRDDPRGRDRYERLRAVEERAFADWFDRLETVVQ